MKFIVVKILFLFIVSSHAFAITRFSKSNTSQEKNKKYDTSSTLRYAFNLGLSLPNFKDGVKHLDKMYGKPSYSPVLKVMYFFDYGFVSLAPGFSISWYGDSGKVVKKDGEGIPSDDNITLGNQKINLSLLPYNFSLNFELHPFGKNYFVINSWIGYEELYWEETRTVSNTSDSENTKVFLNKGWNSSWLWGASVNFRIDNLDEKSSRSMKKSFGISKVSLVPYFEQTINRKSSKLIFNRSVSNLNFARNIIGIAFQFDTL